MALNITQKFYDSLASEYDKLFLDWEADTREQAEILNRIFADNGFGKSAEILDCACGIGTQAIGLARLGYNVTASDISDAEIAQAKSRAEKNRFKIRFENADFCALSETFGKKFDIIIAMDNALPHMLTAADLEKAVKSIANQLKDRGIFVGSIRDYDALLADKPSYSPPYIHKTADGQRVSFQTWEWSGERYKLIEYIIDDAESLKTSRFECEYRATRRQELTKLFLQNGCNKAEWLFPEETGFYQPIIVAKR